jgi:hypothetical protein
MDSEALMRSAREAHKQKAQDALKEDQKTLAAKACAAKLRKSLTDKEDGEATTPPPPPPREMSVGEAGVLDRLKPTMRQCGLAGHPNGQRVAALVAAVVLQDIEAITKLVKDYEYDVDEDGAGYVFFSSIFRHAHPSASE